MSWATDTRALPRSKSPIPTAGLSMSSFTSRFQVKLDTISGQVDTRPETERAQLYSDSPNVQSDVESRMTPRKFNTQDLRKRSDRVKNTPSASVGNASL